MAKRRMLSKDVIDRDSFIALPGDAQRLYFFLTLQADDEGFVGNPKGIADMWHIAEDCLRLLTVRRFVIPFESGCIVIRHWKLHNQVPKKRLTPTIWKRERAQLVEIDGEYMLLGIEVSADALPLNEEETPEEEFTGDIFGNEVFNNFENPACTGKVRKDQVRSDQVRVEESRTNFDDSTPPTLEEVQAYCADRRARGFCNYFDPQYFWEYNNARGWQDDRGRPIRWRLLVVYWENQGGERDKAKWMEQEKHRRTETEMEDYLSVVNRFREEGI